MNTLTGRWALHMRTPIGSIHAEMTFTPQGDGFVGLAVGTSETVELRDIRLTPGVGGDHVLWSQTITKPLRLNLDFDVVLVGDEMQGHSRAGRLPRSAVTGRRIST